MKVFVTGGAGYIGGIMSELLLNRDHAVVVIDNLSQGHRAAVPRQLNGCTVTWHPRRRSARPLTSIDPTR